MRMYDKLYITELTKDQMLDLSIKFTYTNPEYEEKARLKLSLYNTPTHLKHYKLYVENNTPVLCVPRGGLHKVVEFFKLHNIPLRILDERCKGYMIDVKLENTVLEPHQNRIVENVINNQGGLIEAPPGAGKTIAMLACIAKVKTSTLILVHEHRLKQQWLSEIRKRLTGSFTLGTVDGNKKQFGDITVGLIHSIYRLMEDKEKFIEKFGTVIIDECHRIPASMYLKVLNNLPSFYRIGVTGTVKRKDGRHILLYDILGDVLDTIVEKTLSHRITSFQVRPIYTNISFSAPVQVRRGEVVLDYTKLLTQLTENKERNDLIINTIIASIQEGYFPLVLSDRVNHLKFLYEELTHRGFYTILLIGETRKETDWAQIQKDTRIQCIVAQSQIAAEGLDLPRLSALHLTCPSSNKPKLKQKIGRIRRFAEGKPIPIVYDYIDNGVYIPSPSGNISYILKNIGYMRLSYYKQLQSGT